MTVQELIDTDFFIIDKEEEGIRIDKLLANRFDSKSRSYFQYLIENNCVLINGTSAKKRICPKAGDEIEILFRITPEISLDPEDIPLDIIYEDEDIIAINKPAGMVVHPAPGNWSKTFVNALLFHVKERMPIQDSLRPGIVHRLDKDTTGLLLAAKTLQAHQKLISLFSQRKIQKEYLAICLGNPPSTTISKSIARHPINRKKMAVSKEGKSASTEIYPLGYSDKLSLVLAKPVTGRTHQIRVHLKHLNTPILGDKLYGSISSNSHFKAERQLLHAYRLTFPHPITKLPMTLIAPIPKDIKAYIQKIGAA